MAAYERLDGVNDHVSAGYERIWSRYERWRGLNERLPVRYERLGRVYDHAAAGMVRVDSGLARSAACLARSAEPPCSNK